MSDNVMGYRIAVLATNGVEEAEILQPVSALKQAGCEVKIVAPGEDDIQAMQSDVNPASKVPVDATIAQATAANFDALVLPGGTTNADKLRADADAVAFVKHFVDAGKPIAAICHGPWTLIEAGGVKGKRMTSWPSLKTDLSNAGAEWVDQVCVRDGGLVTSRKPDDLPEFCKQMVSLFSDSGQRRDPVGSKDALPA